MCIKVKNKKDFYFLISNSYNFNDFRWQIEFKTIAQNAIILYNAGGGRSDFIAVEILEGVVQVKMARGQIVHTMRINDGQWHKMNNLLFNPSLIEVSLCQYLFIYARLNLYLCQLTIY